MQDIPGYPDAFAPLDVDACVTVHFPGTGERTSRVLESHLDSNQFQLQRMCPWLCVRCRISQLDAVRCRYRCRRRIPEFWSACRFGFGGLFAVRALFVNRARCAAVGCIFALTIFPGPSHLTLTSKLTLLLGNTWSVILARSVQVFHIQNGIVVGFKWKFIRAQSQGYS